MKHIHYNDNSFLGWLVASLSGVLRVCYNFFHFDFSNGAAKITFDVNAGAIVEGISITVISGIIINVTVLIIKNKYFKQGKENEDIH